MTHPFFSKLPRLTKWIIPAVLLVVSGVVLYFLFQKDTLTLSGLVQANTFKNASRFGGRVKKVLVKEGDIVEKGQELIVFDDLDLKAQIAQAQAALIEAKARQTLLKGGPDIEDIRQARASVSQAEESLNILSRGGRPEELTQAKAKVKEAQSQLQTAQSVFENSKTLLAEGIISQQKYDTLQTQYEAAQSALAAAKAQQSILASGARPEQIEIAKSQVGSAKAQYQKLVKGAKPEEVDIAMAAIEQAESTLESLQAQLTELTITSPINGSVSVLNVQTGELVQPGRPVISIIDYQDLWTDVYVPETKLDYMPLNKKVTITAPAFKNSRFTGKVVAINPKSEFVPSSKNNVSPEQSAFRVKIRIRPQAENTDKILLPGMKVTVALTRE